MMTFNFDLISDLHVETWDNFDWTGQATSLYCIVAGDVCKDRQLLIQTLTHLGECYAGVFYIDGNDEHRNSLEDLGESYRTLSEDLKAIKNVVYMQDNVVIINGVAILATNGWWTYDFNRNFDPDEIQQCYMDYVQVSKSSADSIIGIAYHDASYLINSIGKLQTHQEVKSIVVVSHTLPAPWLADYDNDLVKNWRFGCVGNAHMEYALDQDTENKIKAWCFGHYHRNVDQYRDGIRYINNPRGRGNTPWSQSTYYPKRITVEI